MKKVIIIIERSQDAFWAYSEELPGISGVGNDIEEVQYSVEESIEIQKELGNISDVKYEFIYKFDTESFLKYFKGIFTMAALERLTGINQRQLAHYAAGLKKPRAAQVKKIEDALHKLGKELTALKL